MKLLITGCVDHLMWYSDKIGQHVPYLGDTGTEYKSREDEGYINFVQYCDAAIVYNPLVSDDIELQSGSFSLSEPRFDITDIAHNLSLLCRFNGSCSKFYSVAEHSLLVAHIVKKWGYGLYTQRQALLHDATEAYLGDVVTQYKELLTDWCKLEHDLETKLYKFYDLGPKSHLVKKADQYALFIEANQLLPSKGVKWDDPHGYREKALEEFPADEHVLGSQIPQLVEYEFLIKYEKLFGDNDGDDDD